MRPSKRLSSVVDIKAPSRILSSVALEVTEVPPILNKLVFRVPFTNNTAVVSLKESRVLSVVMVPALSE
ncbi:MAG: hypothetical protein UW13_C0012G0017 [candidate division WWE3 bacterium GW2011_GWA1_43_94]|nr:MAG: hypothetical protein UW13_C0012G0017 [candidate division WWE3 bacterium GW2011_GWA1_43_94]